ncbi:MAG: hypothetical protein EZS28_044418 [Streblomastix strix]|uniref:Uncharacterized protein n=1 Tax=Streblomastix strix TaxID=222440 RepID=A0A5J4TNE5_9EUKA|nr:MAG: hypothetical protein EZS28_044418 [Streblomastix strix]
MGNACSAEEMAHQHPEYQQYIEEYTRVKAQNEQLIEEGGNLRERIRQNSAKHTQIVERQREEFDKSQQLLSQAVNSLQLARGQMDEVAEQNKFHFEEAQTLKIQNRKLREEADRIRCELDIEKQDRSEEHVQRNRAVQLVEELTSELQRKKQDLEQLRSELDDVRE